MNIIGLMFPLVFIIVIGTFVVTAVKGLTEWSLRFLVMNMGCW